MYLCRNDVYSNSANQAVYKQEPLNCIHKSLVDPTFASVHPANQHLYRVWVQVSLQLNVKGMQGTTDSKEWGLNTGLRCDQKQTLHCSAFSRMLAYQVSYNFFLNYL